MQGDESDYEAGEGSDDDESDATDDEAPDAEEAALLRMSDGEEDEEAGCAIPWLFALNSSPPTTLKS